MKARNMLLLFVLIVLCHPSVTHSEARKFEIENITDNILLAVNPDGGEDQLVIASEKGLVVFNTFWSEITAQRYKDGIAAALDRNDFYMTINTSDRLDMFGGNAAYRETTIIGHRAFLDKYRGKEDDVDAEIKRLIEMWRWKEGVSRERLETHEPGSETAINEERWANSCKQRAEELEDGFSLVLPNIVYNDRMTLNLGDITLELIWFGRAGYDGMTVAVIPEESIAVIPGFLMHSGHLAPHPHYLYAKLDVPRWIEILEDILEGENRVERVICDINQVWSNERACTRLRYIRDLWNSVIEAERAGKGLDEIQEQLSLDNEFAFVKEFQIYKESGDDWVRPQHIGHVRLFFLQQKNLASEIMKSEGCDSIDGTLARIRKLRESGSDIYFDEFEINGIGYHLLGSERFPEAIKVFELNVELFPRSSNVYDSLGEAYMKGGDKSRAVENYKKSLEINPDNSNAEEMLKKLEE